jgi:hypothetical protein
MGLRSDCKHAKSLSYLSFPRKRESTASQTLCGYDQSNPPE